MTFNVIVRTKDGAPPQKFLASNCPDYETAEKLVKDAGLDHQTILLRIK